MHILGAAAVPLAALVAFPLLAAKPSFGTPPDAEREAWRGRAVSACVAALREIPDLSADDREGICGCTLDSFLDGRETAALPPLEHGGFRGTMESDLLACTAELRQDRVGAVGRGIVAQPPVARAPPFAPKPPPDDDAAIGTKGPPFDPLAWLRGLAVPAWAWIAGAFALMLLIAGLVRRRDDPRHLLEPPPSMRRGGPPVAPRLPNPPPPR